MTLNLSCDPKVSSPDNLFSMKIGDWYCVDEYPDKNKDGFDDYLNLNWGCKCYCDYRKEISEMMSQSHDILDMLPSDPFGMNISAKCSMITGWIGEVDEDFGYSNDELFSGLNLVLPEATRIYHGVDDIETIGKSVGDEINRETLDEACDGSILLGRSKESINERVDEGNKNCCDGAPPEALFFALGYLGVRDLLSVEKVCKSLRDGVRNDPLLWRSIHIDHPLSETFTDDSLLKLTNRACGSLQCLSLVKCLKITDNGLKSVFQYNPGLTKLSVPGCIGLTVEGLLCNIKAMKSAGGAGIKYLRISGLSNVTNKQFEELKHVLSIDNPKHLSSSPKPRFYNGGQLYLSFDDDRAIDIEACPKCSQFGQIYDCPAESCQGRRNGCRACTLCTARCISCGCCFNERDFMETFCLDFLCLDCLTQFLNFPDSAEEDMSISSKQPTFHKQESYHFCLYG